jgi:1-acyl-sn-glycerol-3-phosphate acyltransferase
MRTFLQRLYYYYFYTMFALSFLALYPLCRYYLLRPRYHRKAHKLRRFWARLLMRLTFMRYEVVLPEGPVDFEKTYIICSNHSSEMDIVLSNAAIPLYMGFLAKAELSKIPLLNIFFRTIDIEVDRGSGEASATAYRKSVKALQEGKSLMIFPEGGILSGAPALQPFKEGAFSMAVRQKIPLLPVSMPDSWKVLPDEKKLAKAGKIRIILHKPIETEGLGSGDVPALKERVFNIINQDIQQR